MLSQGENANANFEVNIIPEHANGRAAAAYKLFTSKGKVEEMFYWQTVLIFAETKMNARSTILRSLVELFYLNFFSTLKKNNFFTLKIFLKILFYSFLLILFTFSYNFFLKLALYFFLLFLLFKTFFFHFFTFLFYFSNFFKTLFTCL